jgi:threonine/homoserine/homoserine lactone efflux protein
VTLAAWASLMLAILLIELTPGPNMAWLAALSLGQGRRAGLAACAGIALGLLVNALVAGFGVAAFIVANPGWWEVLRWSGVAFMLWLAWEAWRDAGVPPKAEAEPLQRPAQRHFVSGLVVNLLNPKALLFFAVLIPQYLGSGAPPATLVIAVSLVSVVIATAVHVAIVLTGSSLSRWLADGGRSRPVRRGLALSLLLVALWFAVQSAPA